jgi:ABC-type sugar transport system permease subunit
VEMVARQHLAHPKKKFDKGATIFYVAMIAIPLIQFCIFYLYVNFNSILLAFKHYAWDDASARYAETWVGWMNFRNIFSKFQNDSTFWGYIRNSFYYLLLSLGVTTPLSLLFAYYIYKDYPLSKLFKILLFLPAVVCSMVFVIFYLNFAENVMPSFFSEWFRRRIDSVFQDQQAGTFVIMLFYVWLSFAGSFLLYLNSMSTVSKSVIEAAVIDGAGDFRVFFHVILPGVWKTIVSLIIVIFAGVVADQANLFAFYNNFAPSWSQTIGYYQFNLVAQYGADSPVNYPEAAAFGLLFTCIVAPIVLLARYLLNKYGPKED